MEQLKADVMVGPLSGDEAVAIANYAKAHPKQDVHHRDGRLAGSDNADRAEEHVPLPRGRRPVERRHRRDRVQEAGWRNAAIIMDDYSFGWTSAAGMIADFCAIGGKITKRVFPPLNTTRLRRVRPAAAGSEPGRRVLLGRRWHRREPEGVRAGVRQAPGRSSSSGTCSSGSWGTTRKWLRGSSARTSAGSEPPRG